MVKEVIKVFMDNFGKSFSKNFGINLETGRSDEVFKWFLASVLFGAPIGETIVRNTYRKFEEKGLLTPDKILAVGWDGLVSTLDAGGYVRYDFKTADKLLEVMGNLESRYDGDLNALHGMAEDLDDLEKRIKDLGKGIGRVTVNIFLRELRGIWDKANPFSQELAILAARNLGFIKRGEDRTQVLRDLQALWEENKIVDKTFVDFESSLVKLGKDFCRRKKCGKCLVKTYCITFGR